MSSSPPSFFNPVIASLIALVIVPPLAPVVWVALSGPDRPEYLRSWWIRGGIAVLLICAAPLLAVVIASALGLLSDPNPNPIGFGLLFVAGAAVETVLVSIGAITVWTRLRKSGTS